MRKNSVKNTRVNGEVQRVLAEIIRGGLKDPRISPWTSVVAVEVAPDLKSCKAWISVLGDEEVRKSTLQGLKERRRLYPQRTGSYHQSAQHSGYHFCDGSVHRIRCQYVPQDR